MLESTFQLLDILGRDRIEPRRTQDGDQMNATDRFLGRDAVWLLPVSARIAIDEPWPEYFECRHLLRLCRRLRVASTTASGKSLV